MPKTITLTLQKPTPLQNTLLRTHYRTRATNKLRIGREIMAQLGAARPAQPLQRAHVLVERWSCGTPDRDGLVGGVKDVLDCLTTPTPQANGKVRNKYGMGLILDDSPKHITLEVRPVKCKRVEQKTVIVITELEG